MFPREMNVAATQSMTTKPRKIQVRVISDPAVKRNTHEFQMKGACEITSDCNEPHPENPHTSALAHGQQ
jgi:predicted dinucleotide-utilizing enzyme